MAGATHDKGPGQGSDMARFIRGRGFPPMIPCTGVEPTELIDQMDGLLGSTVEPVGDLTTGKTLHPEPWGNDAARVENAIDDL